MAWTFPQLLYHWYLLRITSGFICGETILRVIVSVIPPIWAYQSTQGLRCALYWFCVIIITVIHLVLHIFCSWCVQINVQWSIGSWSNRHDYRSGNRDVSPPPHTLHRTDPACFVVTIVSWRFKKNQIKQTTRLFRFDAIFFIACNNSLAAHFWKNMCCILLDFNLKDTASSCKKRFRQVSVTHSEKDPIAIMVPIERSSKLFRIV